MSTQKLYDQWSATYDRIENPTRDLEKVACEKVLSSIPFRSVIELGGGIFFDQFAVEQKVVDAGLAQQRDHFGEIAPERLA